MKRNPHVHIWDPSHTPVLSFCFPACSNLSSCFSVVWEPLPAVFSFASEEEGPVGPGDGLGRGGREYAPCWQGSVPGAGDESRRVPSPSPRGSCDRPALPCPACLIGIVNNKWQSSCENLKEQSPTGHLRPTPQPGRKCQLRPAGGDVVHQMHSCCTSSSLSPESGLQPDGVCRGGGQGESFRLGPQEPPGSSYPQSPLIPPSESGCRREGISLPHSVSTRLRYWHSHDCEAGLSPARLAQQLASLCGPVGDRPSGRVGHPVRGSSKPGQRARVRPGL